MIKRLTLLLSGWTITAGTACGDWEDHFHHHSYSTPDPDVDAFMWTMVLATLSSAVLLIFAGPFLVIWVRRVRDIFLIIPAANLFLYLLSISLRRYPGGFAARFRLPGLAWMLVEVILLFLLSGIVALLLAAVHWLVRKARSLGKKDTELAHKAPGP